MNPTLGEANMSCIESKPAARVEAPSLPDVCHAPDRNRARAAKAQANRKRALALAVIAPLFGLISISASPRMAASQGVQLVKVDVAVVAKGYRASKLIGTSVINDKNENIGSLDDLVVDKKQVLFAVLQVGGFLGIGKHLVAVPYDTLQVSEDGKKVTLPGASKDEIKKLSEFKYQT
jgi:sporulation protein YlmC with PRC-barrel domain